MNIFEIREIILNDAQLLFDWANDLQTRQNSFNSNPISWPAHINWLNVKLADKKIKNYLISLQKIPVVVVKFETNLDSIIGVTVAPEQRGKGIASMIIKKACATFWESYDSDILAYIKEENLPSIKAFKKAGFLFFKTENFNNSNCLIFKATKDAS